MFSDTMLSIEIMMNDRIDCLDCLDCLYITKGLPIYRIQMDLFLVNL